MSKHTPGPWELSRENTRIAVYQPDSGTVAYASMDLAAFEANARLIAAAPDLLEACEAVLSMAGRIAKLSEVDAEVSNDLHKLLDPIVAKAKGKEDQ